MTLGKRVCRALAPLFCFGVAVAAGTALAGCAPEETDDPGARPAATPWEEAAREGIEFRAIGQEPGWTLDIHRERWLRLTADYGALQVLFPASAPRISPGPPHTETWNARSGNLELHAVIIETDCTDVMSGERFSHTVTVRFDGRELAGCGRVP